RSAPAPRRLQAAPAADEPPPAPGDVAYRDSLPTIPAPAELESALLAESRRRDSQRAAADAPEVSVAGWSEFARSHPPARKSHPELERRDDNGAFPRPPKTGFGSLRTLNSQEAPVEGEVEQRQGAPSIAPT